ncbi:MAG: hypothetical protein AAGJ95_11880 [Cyanobacteria bacterium J06554_11]
MANTKWRIKGRLAQNAAKSYNITFQVPGSVSVVDGVITPASATQVVVPCRLRSRTGSREGDVIRQQFPGANTTAKVYRGWVNNSKQYTFALNNAALDKFEISGTVTIGGQSGRIEIKVTGDDGASAPRIGQKFIARFTPTA